MKVAPEAVCFTLIGSLDMAWREEGNESVREGRRVYGGGEGRGGCQIMSTMLLSCFLNDPFL